MMKLIGRKALKLEEGCGQVIKIVEEDGWLSLELIVKLLILLLDSMSLVFLTLSAKLLRFESELFFFFGRIYAPFFLTDIILYELMVCSWVGLVWVELS